MINRTSVFMTDNTKPCQNLAVEEYLTMHTQEGECILFLWQNKKTVVIGRNQNCWKECRVAQLKEDGGQIVRRLSGGGAVFHDLGNLNFTFCVKKPDYDVSRQMDVILEAVKSLGLPAQKTGRNDATVQGRKFSGNAFYEWNGCCYHHGTLLIDVDKQAMAKYLNVSAEKLKSRGVDSVRSRVANLKEFLPQLTVADMKRALVDAFGKVYGCPAQPFSKERLYDEQVEVLRQKFASWEWIYGKKVPFSHTFGKRFAWGDAEFQFEVESGLVRDVNVFSDGMSQEFIAALPEAFTGCRYDADALTEALSHVRTPDGLQKEMSQDIAALLHAQI